MSCPDIRFQSFVFIALFTKARELGYVYVLVRSSGLTKQHGAMPLKSDAHSHQIQSLSSFESQVTF